MKRRLDWTTPEDLRAQVQKLWDEGRILASIVSGAALFPLRLRLRTPTPVELAERFDDARKWMRNLEEGAREPRGRGYELTWTEVDNRLIGRNRLPSAVHVPTEEDALSLIRKASDAARFRTAAAATVDEFPELRDWLIRKPLVAMEHAQEWEKILSVLRWFRAHPRPGIYLRQLDIPSVDTKFIELRRGLLSQLLDQVMAPGTVDVTCTGASAFDGRYGLRRRPAVIRMRFLDEALYLHGMSDLTVPVAELARYVPPVTTVFVTENEINGLSFPPVPQALVLFGSGYAVDKLETLSWLDGVHVHYWGDLDTHGFAILARLRARFPRVRSLMMDRETLIAHRELWVEEKDPHRGTLRALTQEEAALFEELQQDALGTRVRLEQERISFGWVTRAVERIGGDSR